MFSKQRLMDKKQRKTWNFERGEEMKTKKEKKNRKQKKDFKDRPFWGTNRKKNLENCRRIAFLGLLYKTRAQKHRKQKNKTTKRQKKNGFLHFGEQPLIVGKLVFFSSYTLSCLQSCVLLKTL